MKAIISFPQLRLVVVAALVCAGLGFLHANSPLTPATQLACSTPYFFTTLALKAPLADATAITGGTSSFELKGLAVDAAGNIYAANTRNHTICRVTPAGEVSILAGRSGCMGCADGTGSAARFRFPQSVAVDGAGNVYVADSGNNTIRRITPAGVVTTLAGLARQAGSADGMGTNARFNFPNGVALDSSGNVYVADLYNATIRKVIPDGTVKTLAGLAGHCGVANGVGNVARFDSPVSVAVDSADDVYVADLLNNSIRKVTATGMVTTLAGQMTYAVGNTDGPGTAAGFFHPYGLAVDAKDNIYVADLGNSTIRIVTPAGAVMTLAGLAGQPGNADGTGNVARFDRPASITLDQAGNLYVGRLGPGAIRKGVLANVAIAPTLQPSNVSFSLSTP